MSYNTSGLTPKATNEIKKNKIEKTMIKCDLETKIEIKELAKKQGIKMEALINNMVKLYGFYIQEKESE